MDLNKFRSRPKVEQLPWIDPAVEKAYNKFLDLTKKPARKGEDPKETLLRHELLYLKDGRLELVVVMEDESMERGFQLKWILPAEDQEEIDDLAGWLTKLIHGDRNYMNYLPPIRLRLLELTPGQKLKIPAKNEAPSIEDI
jgi:hypothetical protein